MSGNRILSRLVAVDGLDSASSTTQVEKIADRLGKLRVPHFLTREPTDGRIGRLIRSLPKLHQRESPRPVSGQALTLLFAADRTEPWHGARGITERLADVDVVISDRSIAASLAYQSLNVPVDYIGKVTDSSPLRGGVILLNTPVHLCQKRLRSRGRVQQRFDDAATQRPLLAAYDTALECLRFRAPI